MAIVLCDKAKIRNLFRRCRYGHDNLTDRLALSDCHASSKLTYLFVAYFLVWTCASNTQYTDRIVQTDTCQPMHVADRSMPADMRGAGNQFEIYKKCAHGACKRPFSNPEYACTHKKQLCLMKRYGTWCYSWPLQPAGLIVLSAIYRGQLWQGLRGDSVQLILKGQQKIRPKLLYPAARSCCLRAVLKFVCNPQAKALALIHSIVISGFHCFLLYTGHSWAHWRSVRTMLAAEKRWSKVLSGARPNFWELSSPLWR
jgi:hypothetical protein